MPKRPNPFGDVAPLQFKAHISKKDVDLGVRMTENMPAVYERTIEKLYEGSRRLIDDPGCANEMCVNDWDTATRNEETQSQSLRGQLRLDIQGQLCGASDLTPQFPAINRISNTVNGGACGSDMEMETDMKLVDEVPSAGAEGYTVIRNSVTQSPRKQLQISFSGKLCSALKEVNPSKPPQTLGFRICHSCNRPSNIASRQCNFCDKSTCINCVRKCDICGGLFCHICSVLNYDDSFERSYCLPCVP